MLRLHLTNITAAFALVCLFPMSALAEDPNPPSIHSTSGAWPIHRQWTPAEARHYARWVEQIFMTKTKGNVEQRTAKIEGVLTDPAMNLLLDPSFLGEGSNPQLPSGTIRTMHNLMDCGKFTAFMPAYYAYRRALPWMSAVVRSGGGDIRTSEYNTPVSTISSFEHTSVARFFQAAVGSFISGNYRVNLIGPNAHLSDTLPVALNREFLIPGIVNYIDGHCLLLAHVSEYGELRFLNCSTTRTRDIFTYNGMNTVSGIRPRGNNAANPWEGCFQGLRVPRYPIAITDASGRVTSVRRRTNEEMVEFGFSTEQFDYIREMRTNQRIVEDGLKVVGFHDFLRLRMKTVDTIVPAAFMEDYADEILEAYTQREAFVQGAWQDVRARGSITFPEELPGENIFQATGRWETWSSPSSDVDRRNLYFYLADWLEYAIRLHAINPGAIDTTGLEGQSIQSQSDLARALVATKNRIFAERAMEYVKSNGERVHLTLLDIEERLYDLSFDPNHPPELRWGAPLGSEERASAPETVTPLPDGKKVAMEDAYRWQAYYRSLGQRETDVSCLWEMFTSGYPVRPKLDEQVGTWFGIAPMMTASREEPGLAPVAQAVTETPGSGERAMADDALSAAQRAVIVLSGTPSRRQAPPTRARPRNGSRSRAR